MPIRLGEKRGEPRLGKCRGGFVVTWWEGNRRRRFSLGTSDKTEARERFASWTPPVVPRRIAGQNVYFIQTVCPTGFVKIGIALNPKHRLGDLQMSCPYELRLLAWISGGEAKERELHARFNNAHVRGEWFRPTGDLMAYVESIKPPPVPPAPKFDVMASFREMARLVKLERASTCAFP